MCSHSRLPLFASSCKDEFSFIILNIYQATITFVFFPLLGKSGMVTEIGLLKTKIFFLSCIPFQRSSEICRKAFWLRSYS